MKRQRKVDPLPASTDGARKRLLARIHILAQDLKLGDEVYRDVLERIGGERSAALLDDEKLYEVVRHLERLKGNRGEDGRRPAADSPMAMRCRALWLTLWNLDELEDGSERALNAFARRQTGRDDMRFCTAEQLSVVIEALKDMCARAGIDMRRGASILVPKRNLVREQWARLHRAGWARVAGDFGLSSFAHGSRCTPNARPFDDLEAAHLDRLATKLGGLVRDQRLGRRRDAAETAAALD